jgi:hypothetical protein
MTFPRAMELFRYWEKHPPIHECAGIALRIWTTFGKGEAKAPTIQEIQKSLEERWNAGAMSPKQMFELFGNKPVQAGGPPSLH